MIGGVGAGFLSVTVQQPDPLGVVAGLVPVVVGAVGGAPVILEILGQAAAIAAHEVRLEQLENIQRPVQPALFARGLIEGEEGFQRVHVRILAARTGMRRAFQPAAILRAHRLVQIGEGFFGHIQNLRIAGGAVRPGAGQKDEGMVIGVAARILDFPLGRQQMNPAGFAVGAPAAIDQIVESVRRQRLAAAVPSKDGSMGENIDLAGLYAQAPDGVIVRLALQGETFDKSAARGINAAFPP